MSGAAMPNKIKVGFFSLSEVLNDHGEYVGWHQLDHMPEQFQIAGLSWGQRWVASPALRNARAAGEGPLAAVQYVTNYLMEDPVDRVLRDFQALAHQLRGQGRFLTTSQSHLAAPFQLLATYAAPRVQISAESVPYRPNTGVYLIVEERTARAGLDLWLQRVHQHDMPRLLTCPGVAGAWCYATTRAYAMPGVGETGGANATEGAASPWAGYRITVVYLDGDPLGVAHALEPWLAERWRDAPVLPLLAGPFESFVIAGRWDRFA